MGMTGQGKAAASLARGGRPSGWGSADGLCYMPAVTRLTLLERRQRVQTYSVLWVPLPLTTRTFFRFGL